MAETNLPNRDEPIKEDELMDETIEDNNMQPIEDEASMFVDEEPINKLQNTEVLEQASQEKQQTTPYSRLGGPLFVSLPKYRQIGSLLSSMIKKTDDLKKQLQQIKEMRNKGTKLLCDTLDDLELVESNIGKINNTLKLKS
ncbi:MAG: hypothetical protein B6U87_02600 [Candidatus Aenigmarchaeota archaeon ex4484_52]|nr:MAG: hypothetical protein B6U87_02600 [Candidatus Aenigmarchaeota archaeon ex4484_52]